MKIAKEMTLGLLYCSLYRLGMIDALVRAQILASEKGIWFES